MTFDEAFERVVGVEGGFDADTRDKGNWTGGEIGAGELRGTKYGISAAAYPHLDIANITLEQAKELYIHDYWGKAGIDQLPEEMRYDVFDVAVNSGPRLAVRLVQAAVGVEDDGVLGPVTLAALQTMPVHQVLRRVDARRLLMMVEHPQWAVYSRGWVRRVANNGLL